MKRVLIIEDDDITQNALNDLLIKREFECDIAEDGIDGTRKLRKIEYDLVLLDIRMPGVDGEQVLNIISKNNKTDENSLPPVIVISGFLTKDRVIRLKKLGVAGFLTKPISPEKLIAMVDHLLTAK